MTEVRRFQTSFRRLRLRKKFFDPAFYLERYPDVGAARMHPFLHYLLHGAAEGRKPNPWFDPDYYLARSPQARGRGGDPFADFLEHGRREHSSPHPLLNGAPPDASPVTRSDRVISPLKQVAAPEAQCRPAKGPAVEGSQFACDS